MSTLGGAAGPSSIGYGSAAININQAITLAFSIEFQSASALVNQTPTGAFSKVIQRIAA
jgi:hypothetical protein